MLLIAPLRTLRNGKGSPRLLLTLRKIQDTQLHFSTKIWGSNDDRVNGIISGTIAKDGIGIKLDQYAEVHRIFTSDEVHQYASLIGDHNPIHKCDTDAQSHVQQIVHGMLTASLFSSIFGTLIPGSVYRSQNINFHSPVYSNEIVVGIVRVKVIRQMKNRGLLLTCDTNIFKNCGKTAIDIKNKQDAISCVSGEAKVWLPTKRMD